MSENPVQGGTQARGRILHLGSTRYVLAPRASPIAGEHVEIADRVAARAFLAKLAAEPGNQEILRAEAKEVGGSVPAAFGGRPDEGEWQPLVEALARGTLEVVRLIDHPVSPCHVTTTGVLTLSEVSWGETEGLYPSKTNLYQPDKWDPASLCKLLAARSALTDVATRNGKVRKATPGSSNIERLLRPYHCVENFPRLDPEIDDEVNWFYLSQAAGTPVSHPGTTGTKLVKSYGPFYNIGGGDVKRGDCYLLFYKLA